VELDSENVIKSGRVEWPSVRCLLSISISYSWYLTIQNQPTPDAILLCKDVSAASSTRDTIGPLIGTPSPVQPCTAFYDLALTSGRRFQNVGLSFVCPIAPITRIHTRSPYPTNPSRFHRRSQRSYPFTCLLAKDQSPVPKSDARHR
jgi:hypothetical protein